MEKKFSNFLITFHLVLLFIRFNFISLHYIKIFARVNQIHSCGLSFWMRFFSFRIFFDSKNIVTWKHKLVKRKQFNELLDVKHRVYEKNIILLTISLFTIHRRNSRWCQRIFWMYQQLPISTFPSKFGIRSLNIKQLTSVYF